MNNMNSINIANADLLTYVAIAILTIALVWVIYSCMMSYTEGFASLNQAWFSPRDIGDILNHPTAYVATHNSPQIVQMLSFMKKNKGTIPASSLSQIVELAKKSGKLPSQFNYFA